MLDVKKKLISSRFKIINNLEFKKINKLNQNTINIENFLSKITFEKTRKKNSK